MICAEAEPLLGASLDGELDPRTALEIEQHRTACDACARAYRNLEWLRAELATADLDWSAAADLRPLRAAIRRRHHPSWWQTAWAKPFILSTAAAILLLIVFLPGKFPMNGGGIDRQVVDNHVRSLMANHLIDIPSSDRHTVKPWFQGKLGFSPSVPDLTAEGFVLLGGRLDVIAGQPTAAIVYKRQNHVINVWMAAADNAARRPETRSLDGYNLLRWQQNGVAAWAVSDLNLGELRQFQELIRSR